MPKLNQIIAVVTQKKKEATAALSALYATVQKADLFAGLVRRYQKKDDDGEDLPPEDKMVQLTVPAAIARLREIETDVLDTTLTQDVSNCEARANIEVDGAVIVSNVPVSHLLYLEKKLENYNTFVATLPTLAAGEKWDFDSNSSLYVTPETFKNRSKKVMKNHVKAQATDKHPAQVDVYTEDVPVGRWNEKKLSGAIPATEKAAMQVKAKRLLEAVKFAREKANSQDAVLAKEGAAIFDYLFN